ncbi:MAG: helix-turn-helix domain-containing protein [bacterium]|nr:helix-turn-helix domain-containing protein [bacterium]
MRGDRLSLRISEAAEALGISERHLRAHLSEIPHLQIGCCVVIPVDSLKEWLQAQARQVSQDADSIANAIMEQLDD